MTPLDIAATLSALALLVLADRHREREELDRFSGALAQRFGFADAWQTGAEHIYRSGGAAPTYRPIYRTHGFLESNIPLLAFSMILGGLAAGFLGHPAGFALAAGFAIADKLISHLWLRLPGDTGWAGTVAALVLLALRFDLWGALAGGGMLAGFLGGLWALGKVRGWANG
jgi:hypothetical protein